MCLIIRGDQLLAANLRGPSLFWFGTFSVRQWALLARWLISSTSKTPILEVANVPQKDLQHDLLSISTSASMLPRTTCRVVPVQEALRNRSTPSCTTPYFAATIQIISHLGSQAYHVLKTPFLSIIPGQVWCEVRMWIILGTGGRRGSSRAAMHRIKHERAWAGREMYCLSAGPQCCQNVSRGWAEPEDERVTRYLDIHGEEWSISLALPMLIRKLLLKQKLSNQPRRCALRNPAMGCRVIKLTSAIEHISPNLNRLKQHMAVRSG